MEGLGRGALQAGSQCQQWNESWRMKVEPKILGVGVAIFCLGVLVASLMCTHYGWTAAGLFDSKYAVVWSGVLGATIASIISLCGVMAANRSSLDRLDKQHKFDALEATAQRRHDAVQKDEDRKAAIRREVYTKGVEEVHAVLAAIGGMPERPLSKSSEDVDALQLFLKANAKIWLVAESRAAHLSRDLTSLMSELYLRALRNAVPLRIAMEPVREFERRIIHAESEVQRIETKLAELREQRSSIELQKAAADALTSANDWMKTLRNERHRQVAAMAPGRLKIAAEMFDEMRSVQRVIVQLVCSLREELNLPADEERFLEQLADIERRAMVVLRAAYDQG